MLTQHAQQASGYGINRREVLRGLAAASLVVACPTAAAAAEPLPGARAGRRPGEPAEAFLERVGRNVETAWVDATGTPFPETFPQMFEACRRFPHLAELRVCEWAVFARCEHPQGIFSFIVPAEGFVRPADVDAVIAAHSIETIEQEGEEWLLWRGRVTVISISDGHPAPCRAKLAALVELLTAEYEKTAAASLGRIGQGVERAWTEATGEAFPCCDLEIYDACRRFPALTRLRYSETTLRGYTLFLNGVFTFTLSCEGLTAQELDQDLAAEGIRVLERDISGPCAWDEGARALVIPKGTRYPVAARLNALTLLVLSYPPPPEG